MLKKFKIIFSIILEIYLIANIFLYFNQKDMLYFPDKTDFFECNNFTEKENEVNKKIIEYFKN